MRGKVDSKVVQTIKIFNIKTNISRKIYNRQTQKDILVK